MLHRSKLCPAIPALLVGGVIATTMLVEHVPLAVSYGIYKATDCDGPMGRYANGSGRLCVPLTNLNHETMGARIIKEGSRSLAESRERNLIYTYHTTLNIWHIQRCRASRLRWFACNCVAHLLSTGEITSEAKSDQLETS